MSSKYKTQLPQLSIHNKPFLAEGGLETDLIFNKGYQLPQFAAFTLDTLEGREVLRNFYIAYVRLAKQYKTGIVLQLPTWRLSEPWVRLLGYSDPTQKVIQASREAVELLESIRKEYEEESTPIIISGSLGSLHDAYKTSEGTKDLEGLVACKSQIAALSAAGVDMLSLMTVSSATEAIDVVELAKEARLPILVSFTVETNGMLLSGRSLGDTIRQVDEATDCYTAYFGINCAHPQHFLPVLRTMEPALLARLKHVRANASTKSHGELDNSTLLDRGDLRTLAESYEEVYQLLPGLAVIGGCCGTDIEHIRAIAARIMNVRVGGV